MATGEQQVAALVGIDLAALHMARVYGPDTSDTAVRRWRLRIRKWKARYPERLGDHGRDGRAGRYSLAELQEVAARVRAPDL